MVLLPVRCVWRTITSLPPRLPIRSFPFCPSAAHVAMPPLTLAAHVAMPPLTLAAQLAMPADRCPVSAGDRTVRPSPLSLAAAQHHHPVGPEARQGFHRPGNGPLDRKS